MTTVPPRSDRRWRRVGIFLLIMVGVVSAYAERAGLMRSWKIKERLDHHTHPVQRQIRW